MCGMFFNCKEFNADISRWDTSNVKNMLFLFNGAHSFNADIGAWDVRNVENITMLFFNARSFDRDLSNWELDSLIYKLDAFRGCPIRKEHLPKALR
ncbi:BspA family leucine-rich repeat surface protein [Campylobacter devanensis]|nr:BspA family leucine-rich repeat surface protein [Campylobacter sp. P093]